MKTLQRLILKTLQMLAIKHLVLKTLQKLILKTLWILISTQQATVAEVYSFNQTSIVQSWLFIKDYVG